MDEQIIRVSGFDLPADSKAAAALRIWKLAGGTYKDLIQTAVERYAATEQFKRYVSAEVTKE